MAKPKTALKKKKKEWFEIIAPKEFGSRVIGETVADESSNLIGRSLSANLARITGDFKKQNINVDFLITDVKDNKCQTSVRAFWMQPSSIKRMVRVGVDRVDVSVIMKTKDNVNVRIKPLLITKSKIKSSIRNALRNAMLQEINKVVQKSAYDQLIQSVVSFSLHKELKSKLDKIFPLKTSQIRAVEIEIPKAEEKKEKKPEKAEAPKPEEKEQEKKAEKKPEKPKKKEAEKPKKKPEKKSSE